MKTRLFRLTLSLALILIAALTFSASADATPEGNVYWVKNTHDSGPHSLRQAILDANAHPGKDTIKFDIPGSGVHTIKPQSGLPAITDPVVIDGYSEPGASANTLAVGDNAVLLIELDGELVQDPAGLDIKSGGSTIKGLVINRFYYMDYVDISYGYGIYLEGAGFNVVEGNRIGTNAAGTHGRENLIGIGIGAGSNGNRIGGTTPAARNLISGNHAGIWVEGANQNQIQGNYIGTNANGDAALGNLCQGVELNHANNTLIGGGASARNVISANGSSLWCSGVYLYQSSFTAVGSNLIGTAANGRGKLGNGLGGIHLESSSGSTIVNNKIAFNRGAGIEVIGVSTENAIGSNHIFKNAGLGIDLNADQVTPNDPHDTHPGPNNYQNYPVLNFADSSKRQIGIEFHSAPNQTFRLEFFSNSKCDGSNYGEGKKYLGDESVVTDENGDLLYTVVLTHSFQAGAQITATATDANGNTSEFSKCDTAY